ncbi:MFS transporter [Nonomuraea sp. NN258]|uniref:MFS transporter n=1 Tax=Nonomuraea antri TaxID=2730852 RepID=UPI00156987E6|nr:MFS transporter [Nonomuraea antri]NRQ38235.1 MFS transporter [Nonomuraea antri]
MNTPQNGQGGRRGVLVLAFLILFIDGYDLFTLGTAGPALLGHDTWQVTPATLGMLGAVTGLGMPVGSALAGWAGDRWGRRLPLVVSLGVISAAMLLGALAPGVEVLAVARAITGVGVGALAPLVGALVADNAPAGRRTLHLAVAMAALGIGGAASALLGRLLLPQTPFQWLLAAGALPLLLVPLVWRLTAGVAGASRTGPVAGARAAELFAPGLRRATVFLWAAAFMSFALIYSTSTWLPSVLMSSGYDLGSALEFSMAFTFGAAAGTTGLSLLADRGHLRVITVSGFLLAAAALLALSTQQPRPVLLLLAALAGVGSLGTQSLVMACMAEHYPPALRASGMGFGLGAGRFGAIAGPGYLAAVTVYLASPQAGFYAFVLPAVLGAAAVAALPRTAGTPATRSASRASWRGRAGSRAASRSAPPSARERSAGTTR